ncbi:MAG: potassium-transporting ATPase subunit KdpC [Terracidiphilus sp.]|jgi:K+-transporting ATPase ATPase C chain
MHSIWNTSIRFTLVTAILLGLGYPLLVTGIARVLFPHQAEGSLIRLNDGTIIGSQLLAQSFTSDRYFHPRPSAANYSDSSDYASNSTTSPSGGSNLAQSSQTLITRIQGDVDKLAAQNPGKPVPIDMVTTSASGLDPDITPDAAFFQSVRVAKTRNLTNEAVRALIEQHITGRQLGVLGEPRVNVLELNIDLDHLAPSAK